MSQRGDSPVQTMQRGLLLAGLLWQVGWIVGDTSLWPGENEPSATALALYLPWLGMPLLAVAAGVVIRWPQTASAFAAMNGAALALAAGVALVGSDPLPPASGATLVMVACGAIGLTMPLRAGCAASCLLPGMLLIELIVAGSEVLPALVLTAYAATFGIVCIVVAHLLRLSAQSVAAAHRALAVSNVEEATAAAVRSDAQRHEVLLHDMLLNTLTAVGRGGLSDREDQVRQRCADAADLVESMLDSSGSDTLHAPRTLRGALDDAVAAGFDVEIESDPSFWQTLDAEVARVLTPAVAELVRNAVRHSAGSRITIAMHSRADGGCEARVSDNGVGMRTQVAGRLGLDRAVYRPITRLGGRVELHSAPGRTFFVLDLPGAQGGGALSLQDATSRDVAVSISRGAPVLLGAGLLLSVLVLGATWQAYSKPMLALAALALVALTAALLAQAARSGRLPTWLAVVGVLVVPVSLRLEDAAAAGSAMPSHAMWSSEFGFVVLLVVIMLGRPWTWVAAVVGWWFGQGAVLLEIVRPGMLLLYAAVILAVALRRAARNYGRTFNTSLAVEAATSAQLQALEARRRRYVPLTASTVPLLLAIADGSADPNDEGVQRCAREEERFARSVIRLDPMAGPAQAWMLRMTLLARSRGIPLDAAVVSAPAGVECDWRSLETWTSEALACVRPHAGEPRLTMAADESDVQVTLVAPAAPGAAALDPDCVEPDGTAIWEWQVRTRA